MDEQTEKALPDLKMTPPRRSTRAKKPNTFFSSSEWEIGQIKLEPKKVGQQAKRLGKTQKGSKKTNGPMFLVGSTSQNIAMVGQTLSRLDTTGGNNIQRDRKGGAHVISEGNSSSVNVHKRKTINDIEPNEDYTKLSKYKLSKMQRNEKVRNKFKGENENLRIIKDGKRNSNNNVNLNMKPYSEVEAQNEKSNNSSPVKSSKRRFCDKNEDSLDSIFSHECQDSICPSVEDGKLKQKPNSGMIVGQNGSETDQTQSQYLPLVSSGSMSSSIKVNSMTHQVLSTENSFPSPSTDYSSLLSNQGNASHNQRRGSDSISKEIDHKKDDVQTMENIKEEILDGEVQIIKVVQDNPELPMTPVKSEVVTESGEPIEENCSTDMVNISGDMRNSSGVTGNRVIGNDSFRDTVIKKQRYVSVMERPQNSMIASKPQDGINREGVSVDVQEEAQVGASGDSGSSENSAGSQVAGPSGRVNSQDTVEGSAGLQVAGPSDGASGEGAPEGAERRNNSVEPTVQGGGHDMRGYCGVCSGNDKVKIKMEIEMSTRQFIEVAHVLPRIVANSEL